MLDALPPVTKASAIGVIGARGGRRFGARVIPLTADADPAIRAAAFGALAGVATPGDLPALLTLLDGAAADEVPLGAESHRVGGRVERARGGTDAAPDPGASGLAAS